MKATNGVTSELSRMTRAASVFTEVARKMNQHIVKHANTDGSVVQGTPDAHAKLPTAMNQKPEAFNYARNLLTQTCVRL